MRKETVALKVEKPGKSKKVLELEYQILKTLQGMYGNELERVAKHLYSI